MYHHQVKKLASYIYGAGIEKLNVYDVDGTIASYSGNGVPGVPAMLRVPVAPYIILSARAVENKGLTRTWCDTYNQRPIAIFHRLVDMWSFEKDNVGSYKPAMLRLIRAALPEVELTMFDDELMDMDNLDEINFVMVERV